MRIDAIGAHGGPPPPGAADHTFSGPCIHAAQNPEAADKLAKIQRDLDETKIILHKTIESVLDRGEKLDQASAAGSCNLALAWCMQQPWQLGRAAPGRAIGWCFERPNPRAWQCAAFAAQLHAAGG